MQRGCTRPESHAPRALSRRQLLAAVGAGLGACAMPVAARARGRLPVGGRVAMHIPWPLAAIDPHRADDALAALFGEALFDSLYAPDGAGSLVPALAETEPERAGDGLRIVLREELRTASGLQLDGRDVVASLDRARARSGRAWLEALGRPKLESKRALIVSQRDPVLAMRALASPLCAIVPSAFSPEHPDGTGPFRFQRRREGVVLARNPWAARGPALLDAVVIAESPDLGASLRAFETGDDDIGWLGAGLHESRAGARPFDLGAVAWAVLRTGREAREWDAPGVAQALADGIAPSRVAYLGLGPPWAAQPTRGWGGGACELIVRDDSPWMIELGRAVAATLTRPAHEVTVKPLGAAEFVGRRTARSHALALDVVRPAGPGPLGVLVGLVGADDARAAAELVKRPSRLDELPLRTLTRTLRLGVVGELRVQGSRVPDLSLAPSVFGGGIDFGLSTRLRRT